MVIASRWSMGVRSLILWTLGYALGATAGITQAQTVLFEEDFEGLPLQDSFSSSEVIRSEVWTNFPPTNWTIDNSQMCKVGGVPEFHGWVFLDLTWWQDTAGQERDQFDSERTAGAPGFGIAAVADGDEWHDLSDGCDEPAFHSWMSTPSINTSGYTNLTVSFDSTWRQEVTQEASLEVSYDGGEPVQLFHWNCESGSPDFHDTNYQEHIDIPLNDADSVVLTFGYYNADNDWWWAIDNIEVTGVTSLVTIAPTELSVDEEGPTSESYEIVLEQAPTHNVLITVMPSDTEIDLGNGAGVALTLTFTTDNWYMAQTVTVTAVDDDVYEGKDPHQTIITHTAQSDDPRYDNKTFAEVLVTVIDDEQICGDWGYLPTDLNYDCYVDLFDFALFAQQWMKTLYN